MPSCPRKNWSRAFDWCQTKVDWSCGLHDANCSAGWLKLWSAWCQLFRRLIEVVDRMMPIVPQVDWSCGPHDANCSAGWLKLWSTWCQLFRRLIEVVVCMMPIVLQVYCCCGLHDFNCSAGLLLLWPLWCQVVPSLIEVVEVYHMFIVVINRHILILNLSFLSLSTPRQNPIGRPPPPPRGPADWILPWGVEK